MPGADLAGGGARRECTNHLLDTRGTCCIDRFMPRVKFTNRALPMPSLPKNPTTNRVRVRRTMRDLWVWELVMPDGHVVHQSESFSDRAECESAARKQGVPVYGLSRQRPVEDE